MTRRALPITLCLAAAALGAWCLAPNAFVAPSPRMRGATAGAMQAPAAAHPAGQGAAGQGSAWLTTGAACALLLGGAAARALSVGRQSSSVAMRATGIAINGFGRIGRQVARIAMKDPEVELKLINASYDADYLAYMMRYDTIHGKYDGTIETDGDSLVVDGLKVALSHTRDPAEIPFTENGAEYVCESTGVFLTAEKVQPHLKAGAKKIVFSAPAKDDSHTIVMGVNQDICDIKCVIEGVDQVIAALEHQLRTGTLAREEVDKRFAVIQNLKRFRPKANQVYKTEEGLQSFDLD